MSNSNQLAMVKKDTVDIVAAKVKQFQEAGELHFPANYSPENAMKSAWLILQATKASKNDNYAPVLTHCTKDSIANALLDMVVQGLNPAKKQGYFICYGKQLAFQRSYFGTMAVTKRVTNAKSIDGMVIYEGDDVDYEIVNGRVVNLKHKQKFGNINKDKILGAYATIEMPDGEIYTEIMTMDEIRQAWSQSQMWGKDQKIEKQGSTHDDFKQEMAKKTVIGRACKKFLNSSDDGSLVMQHIKESDERSEEIEVQKEIAENANSEYIDAEYNEIIDDPEPPKREHQEEKSKPEPEPVSAGGPEF